MTRPSNMVEGVVSSTQPPEVCTAGIGMAIPSITSKAVAIIDTAQREYLGRVLPALAVRRTLPQ